MKNNNGITLIALIITIVILLILAAVTINLTLGENGLFSTANSAILEQKKQAYFEEIGLIIIEEQAARKVSSKDEAFIESLQEKIDKKTWVKGTLMCDEEGIEREILKENTKLIIETEEDYEIIIDVDNIKQTAKIRDNYFEKTGDKLKVRYDGNGGIGSVLEQEIRKGFSIIVAQNGFTKEGYTFVGWSKENEEGIYVAGSKLKIEEETILYANWSKDYVTIRFNPNGGTEEMEDIEIAAGGTIEKLPKSNYIKEGYIFIGWKDENNTEYEDEGRIENLSKDITLTAMWQEVTMTGKIETSSLKLTEGTTIEIEGTSNIGIDKVEVLLDNKVIYTELPQIGEEVIESPYNKVLEIKDMNLINLDFYETYTPKVKIISKTESKEVAQEQQITNYTIGNEEALKRLATLVNGTNSLNGFSGETILQVENIELNKDKYEIEENSEGEEEIVFIGATQWVSIGIETSPFRGTYNGGYKTISGIYIENTQDNQGLFGYSYGKIEKVKLVNSSIKANRWVGGIVGFNNASSIIENCSNSAMVKGNDGIGGIAGINGYGAKIQYCTNSGIISSSGYQTVDSVNYSQIGGIVGTNANNGNNTIKYCYNNGNVTGKYEGIGGIVGFEKGNGNTLSYCYNSGTITGIDNAKCVGGIAGKVQDGGKVEYSYNTGNIKDKTTTTGRKFVRWSCWGQCNIWYKHNTVLL